MKPKTTIEPIKLAYLARAANALGILKCTLQAVIGTEHEEPCRAAIEQLERVPQAFNNREARQCLRTATYLLPNVFGLRETKGNT